MSLLVLSGCRLHDLLWAPDYVWACVRWDTYTFSANGQSDNWRVCAEEGWTRAVDTIPAAPETFP